MEKQSIWSSASDFVFPRYCVNCLCYQDAFDLYSFVCARCFLSVREEKKPARAPRPIERLICYGNYADPILRKLIFHFKYRFVRKLSHPLGELLIQALGDGGIAEFLSPPVPVVTYIPLAPLRQRWRGFNQSFLLAEAVAFYFHLPLLPLLCRLWLAPAQASLANEAHRKENIKGAFTLAVSPLLEPPAKVLLIDDVSTSGATLQEAASVLRRWRVKRIWAGVVAGASSKLTRKIPSSNDQGLGKE